ncbi:MAG: elongation factor P [bacterium]|nr:elongation factor P [bacterium]
MISTSDISNGVSFKLGENIVTVLWFQHHKPGKGGAVLRLKLKNLRTSAIFETTVKSGEKFAEINLERQRMQYLYHDGDSYIFMSNETFEQVEIKEENIGGAVKYLQDNMEIDVLFYGDEILGVQLPQSIVVEITYTEKGLKGDTATNALKPATTENGLEIMVPLFIEIGDKVKIDTNEGNYIQRV